MDALASATPNIISGVILLIIGGIFGAAGKAIATAFKKGQTVAHEHTDLVCHLEESEELKSKVQSIEDQQGPQNAVLRELMGSELDREHARLVAQGYASPAEKAAYERKYQAYHGIGGNGTRTALYEDVLQMNSYPTNAKEAS